ncbi:MAG: hypothetical protein NTW13_00925 [Candidatus Omnitrophica bacterium]|nr:hypothetical protein [Candidatus Omnitrophota bacterium]
MIEINLLPEELRGRQRPDKPKLDKTQGISPNYFILLVPSVIVLIVISHLFLGILGLAKNAQLNILSSKWEKLLTQRKMLDDFRTEHAVTSQDSQSMQQEIRGRITWAEKLNKLSLYLPNGVWFNELSITPKEFVLYGAVVSLEKEEMSLIRKLIDGLKNDPGFFKNFNTLELSSAQKRTIGSYDITDFTLTGSFKK